MFYDAQRQELEAEFFAQYDSVRESYSALDPMIEAVSDDIECHPEFVGPHRPLSPNPYLAVEDLEDVPF